MSAYVAMCSRTNPLVPCQSGAPLMANDGSGSDISIPSFLMFKRDADEVKVQVNNQWNVPSDTASQDFLKIKAHLRATKPKTDRDRQLFFGKIFDPKTEIEKTGGETIFMEEVTDIKDEQVINKNGSERKFPNYTSLDWELLWLENIQDWESNQTICQNILSPDQRHYLLEFEKTIC
jgi:hypothetical protein